MNYFILTLTENESKKYNNYKKLVWVIFQLTNKQKMNKIKKVPEHFINI